jgi:hypothetical protein
MAGARWTALGALVLMCGGLAAAGACGGTEPREGAGGADGSSDATTDGIVADAGAPADARRDIGPAFGGSDGATADGSCAPPACPPGVLCGRYTDPCTGITMACGSPCPKGEACEGIGASQSCKAPSCAGRCGVIAMDSCGVGIGCGGCPAGEQCVANQCAPLTTRDAGPSDGGPACGPLACMPAQGTILCGPVADRCGSIVQCPACPAGQQCLGGVCGATPPECDATDAGPHCGSTPNACGSGSVTCPGCTGATTCKSGTCTACTPPSCNGATCGSVSNGCGPAVSCGTCSGETCYDGGCCAPLTCAAAQDAGLVTGCGQVDLGCGTHKSCSPCPTGESCEGNLCVACVPKTCADYNHMGCGHSDGCTTATLDCCTGGTTCQGTICCPKGEVNVMGLCCPPGEINANGVCCGAGQVNYAGTCCQPTCDASLPPGPQNSCGVTIYCSGGGAQ